jgi:outer membrane protein TolC
MVLVAVLGMCGCHSVGRPSAPGLGPPTVALPEKPASGDGQPAGSAAAPLDRLGGGAEAPRLGPQVIPPPPGQQVVSLADALTLAGVESPTIARAEEAVRASQAERMQARALLLPTLNAGLSVNVHQGRLLSSTGIVREVNRQSFYAGAGAFAVGAGPVNVPGIRIVSPLADALFAPQAAEQQVIARRFDAVAVRNRVLLDVGDSYLALAGAQARLEALRRTLEDLGEVVRLTVNQAETGQGKESDAQRARTEWLLAEADAQRAQEEIAVAAAELARLLDLDPSVRLRPADPVVPILEIIAADAPLPGLLQVALANHPELAARAADVALFQTRLRQENVRPWLPTLSAGFSAGNFGGAGNQATDPGWHWGDRIDVDVWAAWSLQNLGFGNRAVQNRVRAEVGEAQAERVRVADRILEEVSAAYALILARRRQLEVQRRQAEVAQKAFEEDLAAARNLTGRPIELLRSLNLLAAARLELVRAMVGYSQAQLRLYVALGNSPAGAVQPRPCGAPAPVGGGQAPGLQSSRPLPPKEGIGRFS